MSQATAILLDWNNYPNFSEAEFMCKCGCGRADMQPEFLNRLQTLRTACDFPFRITSGFRCEAHDRAEKGAGVHPSGLACDINVYGEQLLTILDSCKLLCFHRIGLKQTGKWNKRFIHLDRLVSDKHPSPAIWTYK